MASMVMVLSMTMYCPGNAEASGAGQGPNQATNQNEIKVTQTKPHVAPIPTKKQSEPNYDKF